MTHDTHRFKSNSAGIADVVNGLHLAFEKAMASSGSPRNCISGLLPDLSGNLGENRRLLHIFEPRRIEDEARQDVDVHRRNVPEADVPEVNVVELGEALHVRRETAEKVERIVLQELDGLLLVDGILATKGCAYEA